MKKDGVTSKDPKDEKKTDGELLHAALVAAGIQTPVPPKSGMLQWAAEHFNRWINSALLGAGFQLGIEGVRFVIADHARLQKTVNELEAERAETAKALALAEKNCEFLRKHSEGQSNELRWEHERLLNSLDQNRVWQEQLAEEKAKTARMQREIDALKTQVKGDIGCASTVRCDRE